MKIDDIWEGDNLRFSPSQFVGLNNRRFSLMAMYISRGRPILTLEAMINATRKEI
jgi:hypothetical protein